ncbi:hypothetical protein H0H92_004009 [Tricholoma furcatifolium]|nr:hypothetical protein H0H92_004009 [Tricholoma furcatifolium]
MSPASRSKYFSLEGALKPLGSQYLSTVLSPNRLRLPATPYVPSSGVRRELGRLNQLHGSISFHHSRVGQKGVPMCELAAGSTTGIRHILADASDEVLTDWGLPRIRLHITVCTILDNLFSIHFANFYALKWPGYEHTEWLRNTEVVAPHGLGRITRAQLGSAISRSFAQFLEHLRSTPGSKSCPWNVAYMGIHFEHLILLELINVFDDIWQAKVDVNFRPRLEKA